MILRRHSSSRWLVAAIHPGRPEQRTTRGRITAPAIAPHAAIALTTGRVETTDPDELRAIGRGLLELGDQLEAAKAEAVDAAGQLDLEVG